MLDKRPSIRSIADLAGVSVATVDRVLSDRAKVSQAATMKVLHALRTLGAGHDLPLGARHLFRFEIVMALSDETFFLRYEKAFTARAQQYGVQVRLRRLPSSARGETILQALQSTKGRYHGVAMIAEESDSLGQYCQQLRSEGKAAVFMTSGRPLEEVGYIGIDNRAAGRTAAYLLGGLLGGRGRVLLIIHSLTFHSHAERVAGFMETCARRFPALEISAPLATGDCDQRGEQHVRALLEQGGSFDGIYHTGAGNAGIARAFAAQAPQAWIAHEVTPDNTRLLLDGAISMLIDQNAEQQAEACLQAMLHQLGAMDRLPPPQVPFVIVTPENIKDFY